MNGKKKYTDVLIEIEGRLSSLETVNLYQTNSLQNIDQHLNKLNDRTGNCEVATAKNTTRIHIAYWIGGTLFSGGGVALILWLVGIY